MSHILHALLGSDADSAEFKAFVEKLFQKANQPEPTYEESLQQAIAENESQIRVCETMNNILAAKAETEGTKIVRLDALQPRYPEQNGIVTIATYALPSGAYLVRGIDHLTGYTSQHTVPNAHGICGMLKAVAKDVTDQSIKAAGQEADDSK